MWRTAIMPQRFAVLSSFCCFICVVQWWALHVVIKRQFFYIHKHMQRQISELKLIFCIEWKKCSNLVFQDRDLFSLECLFDVYTNVSTEREAERESESERAERVENYITSFHRLVILTGRAYVVFTRLWLTVANSAVIDCFRLQCACLLFTAVVSYLWLHESVADRTAQ